MYESFDQDSFACLRITPATGSIPNDLDCFVITYNRGSKTSCLAQYICLTYASCRVQSFVCHILMQPSREIYGFVITFTRGLKISYSAQCVCLTN